MQFSEEIIGFTDLQGEEVKTHVDLIDNLHGHIRIPDNHNERLRCAVCKVEEGWMNKCGIKVSYGQDSHYQRHMSVCLMCGINNHSLRVKWERKIHQADVLSGMSCYQSTQPLLQRIMDYERARGTYNNETEEISQQTVLYTEYYSLCQWTDKKKGGEISIHKVMMTMQIW